MHDYGNPIELFVHSCELHRIADELQSTEDHAGRRDSAMNAQSYIITAAMYQSWFVRPRARRSRAVKFSFIQWCKFRLHSRNQTDRVSTFRNLRVLRKIERGEKHPSSIRTEIASLFRSIANECQSKGDASLSTRVDSDE